MTPDTFLIKIPDAFGHGYDITSLRKKDSFVIAKEIICKLKRLNAYKDLTNLTDRDIHIGYATLLAILDDKLEHAYCINTELICGYNILRFSNPKTGQTIDFKLYETAEYYEKEFNISKIPEFSDPFRSHKLYSFVIKQIVDRGFHICDFVKPVDVADIAFENAFGINIKRDIKPFKIKSDIGFGLDLDHLMKVYPDAISGKAYHIRFAREKEQNTAFLEKEIIPRAQKISIITDEPRCILEDSDQYESVVLFYMFERIARYIKDIKTIQKSYSEGNYSQIETIDKTYQVERLDELFLVFLAKLCGWTSSNDEMKFLDKLKLFGCISSNYEVKLLDFLGKLCGWTSSNDEVEMYEVTIGDVRMYNVKIDEAKISKLQGFIKKIGGYTEISDKSIYYSREPEKMRSSLDITQDKDPLKLKLHYRYDNDSDYCQNLHVTMKFDSEVSRDHTIEVLEKAYLAAHPKSYPDPRDRSRTLLLKCIKIAEEKIPETKLTGSFAEKYQEELEYINKL